MPEQPHAFMQTHDAGMCPGYLCREAVFKYVRPWLQAMLSEYANEVAK